MQYHEQALVLICKYFSEMGCKDFVEALIRISEMRFSTAPFKYRLNRLITQHVLLYAERSECDAFRLAVGSEHVSTILRTHKPVLLRIFKSYAVQLENSKSEPYLSLQSFTKFARDCQLLGPRMNLQDLKQLFANIQHVQEDERDQDADSKVDYTEFSEVCIQPTASIFVYSLFIDVGIGCPYRIYYMQSLFVIRL